MGYRLIKTIIIVILACPSLLFTASFQGKIVSVTDGDTIKVLKDGVQVKIRLAAVDCPEKGQPYGQKAKSFTANLVAGRIVKVWETDTDRYSRIVRFVIIGDENLNKELLSAGLARHYKQYSRDPELAKLEFEARSVKRGLWVESDPVAPWEYRRQKRSGESSKVKNVSTDTDARYHGNTSSKVFHRQGCGYYDCKNCTVLFSSRQAAVGCGHRPCGVCKP